MPNSSSRSRRARRFEAIAERVGYQELSGIRRQHESVAAEEASRDFARGAGGQEAIDRYQEHGAIYFAENSEPSQKRSLIKGWAEHATASRGGRRLR